MPHTVACIVVTTPKVFNWLGHMPILNWSLNQLLDVRGIDEIVCVATPELTAQAKKLLAKENVVTVEVPKSIAQRGKEAVDRWLTSVGGPAENADVLMIFRPVSPFLPAGKIEACVESVRRNRADVAFPAREIKAVVENARTAGYAEAPALQVIALKRSPTRIKPVVVALTESLDISNPDEQRLAQAIVAA